MTVTDPQALANAAKRFPELPLEPDLETTLRRADAVLLLTEWKQYRELDPHTTRLARLGAAHPRRPERPGPGQVARGGLDYKGLGRP